MLPNPRCHPDGVRWPCGTGRSCTHVSPRRSRSQHPGMPGRMMMFSWASGCVQSQWRRVKGLEVPQRTRRCRPLAPELPRGSPYPGLPAGSPRPHVVSPPRQAGPRPPHHLGPGVMLCLLLQGRARREDKEPAQPMRHPGSVLLPWQVMAELRRDPHPLAAAIHRDGDPGHHESPPANPTVSCRKR